MMLKRGCAMRPLFFVYDVFEKTIFASPDLSRRRNLVLCNFLYIDKKNWDDYIVPHPFEMLYLVGPGLPEHPGFLLVDDRKIVGKKGKIVIHQRFLIS